MAFRRKFRAARPSFKRRGKPLARVRRTWVTSFEPTVCAPVEIPLLPCDDPVVPAQGRFVLCNNSILQSTFSDRARVVRIVGDLWFIPLWFGTSPDDTCQNQFLAAFSFFCQAFAGLRRYEKNHAGEVLKVDPLGNDDDYSEAQWMKTWQHIWQPRPTLHYTPTHTTKSCAAYVCPDVHTSGILDNDFVNGTGTINIETDCGDPATQECTATQDDLCDYTTNYPAAWHLHLDIKKRISLREDQELALETSFIYGDTVSLVDPVVQVIGGVKVLLEY